MKPIDMRVKLDEIEVDVSLVGDDELEVSVCEISSPDCGLMAFGLASANNYHTALGKALYKYEGQFSMDERTKIFRELIENMSE